MNARKWGAVLVVGLLGVGGVTYYLKQSATPVQVAEPPAVTQLQPIEPKAVVAPEKHYPLPEIPPVEAAPLPKLEDSDAMFGDALKQLLGSGPFESVLVPEFLIRRIVITVDNLTRDRLPLQFLPAKRTAGAFLVGSEDGRLVRSPDNDARYAALVGLLKAAEPDQVVRLYLRYYALFQKAYRELGYTDREFNDRVVAVIDNLLATPELQGTVELVRPKVYYQFADPALEAAPAGQKVLLRIGAGNRAEVKTWLGAVRRLLVPEPATR